MLMLGFAFTTEVASQAIDKYLGVQPHERTNYFHLLAENFSKLLSQDIEFYELGEYMVAFALIADVPYIIPSSGLEVITECYQPKLTMLRELLLKHNFPVLDNWHIMAEPQYSDDGQNCINYPP